MHVPGIKNLIDNFLVEDIATELGLIDLELKIIELHIRKSNGSKIPWHQDNFYHCIKPANGFKVLLPFQKLTKANGAFELC